MLLRGADGQPMRDLERSADHDGQILCAAAGYDPRGSARLSRVAVELEKAATGTSAAPASSNRIHCRPRRATGRASEASELRWEARSKLTDPRGALLANRRPSRRQP